MKSSVFLNGRFIGFHDKGEKLAGEIRDRRRKGEISRQSNVARTRSSSTRTRAVPCAPS